MSIVAGTADDFVERKWMNGRRKERSDGGLKETTDGRMKEYERMKLSDISVYSTLLV